MAIDSTLFGMSLPAGTYAVGDRFPLAVLRGPAVVRDGYGTAKLKKVFSISNNVAATGLILGHFEIKNSNWVDSLSNFYIGPGSNALSDNSNAIQKGHDCVLQPNSTWTIEYVVDVAKTTTTAGDYLALIDIDYPKVASVANPNNAIGYPCSNVRNSDSIAVTGVGSLPALSWTSVNVDILKAGYEYLLDRVQVFTSSAQVGFVSISGAAGQSGLERIIPVLPDSTTSLRYLLDYSTPLVKGPFSINYAAINTGGATTTTPYLELDWVKRPKA